CRAQRRRRGVGRREAASPEVEGGDGDALGGTELRGGQSGGGEAGETFGPELSSGVTGVRGARGFGRNSNGFGHGRPPGDERATPGRYSTRQGRDPPGAYN